MWLVVLIHIVCVCKAHTLNLATLSGRLGLRGVVLVRNVLPVGSSFPFRSFKRKEDIHNGCCVISAICK